MKKILILLLCFATCSIVYAQTETKITWDYPVKPGMEEWNQLITEKERIEALQVPDNILASLSSKEIVDLCITFPAFGYFTAYNTPQEGFSIMFDRFNIFKHLLLRKDAGKSLIIVYKDAGMSGFKTMPYPNDFWSIKLDYLELMLTQKEILQSLTLAEKIELLQEAKLKYIEKINNDTFSSLPSVLFTTRIIASILDIEEYQGLNTFAKKTNNNPIY